MRITIAICTRNHATSLGRVLGRLAEVDLMGERLAEILVVDNGSTDNTRQVIEEWATRLPVRHTQEPQVGVAAARNRAIEESRGEILVFLDDDIWVTEHWLEHLVGPVMAGTADATLGYVQMPDYVSRSSLPRELYHNFACIDDGVFENGKPRWIVTANFCVRRDAIPSGLWFDQELGPGKLGFSEDLLFYLQFSAAGRSVRPASQAAAVHYFQESRLAADSIYQMARHCGESLAYVDHHWLRTAIPRLRLKMMRAYAQLLFAGWKRTAAEGTLAGAVTLAKWHSKQTFAYLQWRWRHRRDPANYSRPELAKARGLCRNPARAEPTR